MKRPVEIEDLFRLELITDARISPDGRLAYVLSTNAVTMPGSGGEPETTRGRAVTIWRREPDGEWRCAIDMWNDDPPEP